MDSERSNYKVLIVDHDDDSLRYLTNVLMEWHCIVKTAKDAQQALATLQTNDGLCDLIIAEFYLQGMNGFDFQKLIQDQFHLPIIMMSKDNSQHLISKSLEKGAVQFMVKPFRAEDFTNIWKYVIQSKKEKQCCKRKNTEEYQGDRDQEYQVVKKPRIVWTTYLHNLFLDAIKQIGSDKAKPKKIREMMNIPNLTTENVASHLQKYQKFQRDVANKGMVEGISNRALKSKFASDLPKPLVKEIKAIRAKHRKQMSENLQALSYQMEHDKNVICFDRGSTSHSSYISHNGINLNFEGFRSDYVSNAMGNNASEFQVASNNEGNAYENIEFHQQTLQNNVTENEQNYNVGTSINEAEFNQRKVNLSNFLMADDMNNLNEMNANNDSSESLKSYMFNFFQDVLPLEQLNKGCDDVSPSAEITTCMWNESPKSSSQNSNQLYNGGNDISPLAGITSCVLGDSPSSNQISKHLYNGGNDVSPLARITSCVLGDPPSSNQISEHLYNGSNDVSPLAGITSCLLGDLPSSNQISEHLYNGGNGVSPLAEITSCMLGDSPSSNQISEHLYNGGNDVSPLAGITSCVLEDSPSSNQILEHLHGNDERFSNGEASNRFMEVDNISKASTSAAIYPEFDMDFIETIFGTIEYKE